MARVIDRDHFMNAPVAATRKATMGLVDSLQTLEPSVQLHAATALFILVAEWGGIPAQDLFTATKNLMSSTEGTRKPEFAAIAAYLENEVPRG